MLIDEMEKHGKWLFRWRSYLPLVAAVLLLSSLPHFVYLFGSHFWDQVWEMFCLGISFLGLFIRIATVGYTPIRTSGRNTTQQVADSLNTSGMYSVVRNPLYLGNFLVGLGFSMFVHVWWVTVIYALLFLVYYERIIMTEELFLQKKFGQEYWEWSKKNPIFFPRFRQWQSPTLPFNIRKVCRNEHQTLFLIVLIFYSLELLGDYYMGQPLMDDLWWNILMGVVVVIFIVFRIIHKQTSWLHDKIGDR